jgi:PHD-finger
LQGPEHLAASTLPEGFPPELAFRALAAYSLLRTLSLELRLSPFTPNVFLRALNLPYPSRLLGQVHVALLKVLLPSLNMGYTYRQRGGYAGVVKRRKVDGLRWELRAGDNLTYLDSFSWPLFYDDYAHLTSDILHSYMKDEELHVDYRIFALRNGPEDSAQIDDDYENKSENTSNETEAVAEEKESLTKEDDNTSRTPRARFGTLPTRKSKLPSTNGQIQLRKPLSRPFLSKSKLSKSAEDSTESEKSDNEHSDFDDAEKEKDKDDEYLAKPSKKKTALSRGHSRKRKLPLGPGSRARDVEVVENGVWKPVANAFCGRPLPSMAHLAPNTQRIPSPAAHSPHAHPYAFFTTQIGVPRPFPKPQITANTPSPDSQYAKSAVGTEKPNSKSNTWKQGEEVLKRPRIEIPLEANNELTNHLCVTSVPKPAWVPTSMAISVPHSYDPPQMKHVRQPTTYPHQVLPYQGMYPSFGLVSVPQGSVTASSPSATMPSPQVPLPAPQRPTTPQRPMYTPKVLAPKFKLEEYKSSGIPVPGSVANTVHDFIFPPKNNEKLAIPIESVGAVISKESTLNYPGNESISAPFKLPLMEGEAKSCHPTSVGSATLQKSTTEEAKIEVGMVLGDIMDRLDPKTEQSIYELDQALSLSVKYKSAPQESNHIVDINAEVRAVLDGIIGKIGNAPAIRMGVTLMQDEPMHDMVSLMNSIIERIERNTEETKSSSEIRESVPLDCNRSETQHRQEADYTFRETLENENDTYAAFSGNNPWPQFDAIKSMRNGMPYYRLPIEQKLRMMEFLIDELLTVDVIAAEFTRRNRIESCYSYPYGAKPSVHDLERLENGDECGVCRLEGDLLCCDGCPRSFHRKCLSMSERAELPDGKWLCPECAIVDPANFGTLWGGRKAAVDWFTIEDIETARIMSLPEEQRVLLPQSQGVYGGPHLVNNVLEEPLPLQNVPQAEMANAPTSSTAFTSAASRELTTRVLSQCRSAPGVVPQSSTKFLVIHGFVFSKETRNADSHFVPSATSLENIKRSYTDHGMMSQVLLSRTMKILGHRSVSEWPLNQIPLNPLQVWGTNESGIVSLSSFFKDPDRFDPSRYLSQYRLASLPKMTKAGSAARQSSIVNVEYESEYIDTRLLSSLMEPDMAQDVSLASALRTTTLLFNPYRMTTVYMEKLESSLKRAYLLNEFWGMRNKYLKMDTWSVNLRKCQSITKLATLIVSLIDATHPRAFVDDWNAPPNGRVKSDLMSSQPNPDDKRSYLPIAEDWSAAGEKRVRKWQQCSVSSFLSLLASETDQLDGLVDGVCERFRGRTTQRTKKRKLNVPVISDARIVSGTSDTTDHKSNSQITPPAARTDDAIHTHVETKEKVAVFVENYTKSQLNADHQMSSVAVCDSLVETSKVTDGVRNNLEANLSTETRNIVDDEVVKRTVKQSSQKKTRRSGRRKTTDEIGLGTSETMASIIESQRRERLEELEHFLKMPLEKELHWPVAGRKLFQPAGILAPSEVRHLGRSAGIVPGAYVTYSKLYEVGQVAVSHLWRKRVLNSNSLEELLIQVRVLDSYLDKIVSILVRAALVLFTTLCVTCSQNIASRPNYPEDYQHVRGTNAPGAIVKTRCAKDYRMQPKGFRQWINSLLCCSAREQETWLLVFGRDGRFISTASRVRKTHKQAAATAKQKVGQDGGESGRRRTNREAETCCY